MWIQKNGDDNTLKHIAWNAFSLENNKRTTYDVFSLSKRLSTNCLYYMIINCLITKHYFDIQIFNAKIKQHCLYEFQCQNVFVVLLKKKTMPVIVNILMAVN